MQFYFFIIVLRWWEGNKKKNLEEMKMRNMLRMAQSWDETKNKKQRKSFRAVILGRATARDGDKDVSAKKKIEENIYLTGKEKQQHTHLQRSHNWCNKEGEYSQRQKTIVEWKWRWKGGGKNLKNKTKWGFYSVSFMFERQQQQQQHDGDISYNKYWPLWKYGESYTAHNKFMHKCRHFKVRCSDY
jgi:hypothetical protein